MDSDGDGIVDLLDLDSDNDGYIDADEMTSRQSNPLDAKSRPKDSDGDHLSDANDPDIDNDGVPNKFDLYPVIPNRPPILADTPEQKARALRLLTLKFTALDVDLPAQNLAFSLTGDVPDGAIVNSDGVFNWTPNQSQADGAHTISVRVTDDGMPPLSDSKSFIVHVQKGIAPPVGTKAYSIGLNFGANEDDSTIDARELVGAPSVSQANWNNMYGQTGTMNGLAADANGTSDTIPVIVRWNSNNTWASTGRGEENNQFTGADRILMRGYLDTGDATTTTITLSNLPSQFSSAAYDVYVYLLGGVPNKGGGYRILDATSKAVLKNYVLAQCNSNPTNYVQVPTNLAPGQSGTGNYIVFSGLTASSVTIEATTAGGRGFGGTPRAPINAIQLIALVKERSPPALAPISDIAVSAGATVAFTVTAMDADLPAQKLTFGLGPGAPVGATLNPSTGAFSWTPSANQVRGANLISVTVTDDGTPPLSDTKTFTVVVQEPFYRIGLNFGANKANSALALTTIAGVPSVRQAYWNNIRGQSGTMTSVDASDNGNRGTASVTVRWNSNNTWASTGRGEENNRFTGADRLLMTGYLDTEAATTTTVTLSNLPPELTSTRYDVYVYLLGGVPNKGGGYRIVDVVSRTVLKSYVLAQCDPNPAGFLQVPTDLAPGRPGTGNYIVFGGLSASAITIEATTANRQGFGNPPRAPLNAVQLVSVPGAPNHPPMLSSIQDRGPLKGHR